MPCPINAKNSWKFIKVALTKYYIMDDVALLKRIIFANMHNFRCYPDYYAYRNRESAYKFARVYLYHIDRNYSLFKLLHPRTNDKVFEIGPGACYLLWFLRRYGCNVSAIDRDDCQRFKDVSFYQVFRRLLSLERCVKKAKIEPFKKMPCEGCYDKIIAARVVFANDWTTRTCNFFLQDALSHLKPKGQLLLTLNSPMTARLFYNVPVSKCVSKKFIRDNYIIIWQCL